MQEKEGERESVGDYRVGVITLTQTVNGIPLLVSLSQRIHEIQIQGCGADSNLCNTERICVFNESS